MTDFPFKLPPFDPGTVWLTGAGPGDPGLISVLAWHALCHADTIVYDALVTKVILKGAPNNAELIYAGKRGGKPSHIQEDITNRLVQLAGEGKRVLRLKGGDPFVFGRGGEEAQALVRAKIPFRIVPGISSGIGGLAYAGIPLTHRAKSRVVTFLTGHNANTVNSTSVDWQAVSEGSQVLVFYMSLRNIAEITKLLMDAGRSREEPVAFVSRATLPDQQVVVSTLQDAARDSKEILTPALVVVGETVNFCKELDWLQI